MPIWDVRREAFHNGLMIEKAMKKMREALGLEEDEDEDDKENENEDYEDEDREDAPDDEMVDNIHGSKPKDLEYGKIGSKGRPRVDDLCTEEHKCTTGEHFAPNPDACGSRCELPVRGGPIRGTTVDHSEEAVEGEWMSVV